MATPFPDHTGEVKAHQLDGIVEADEAYFLRSYKGQPQRLRREQVPVLVARNRAGHTTDALLAQGNKQGLLVVLPQMVAADTVLCTDGSAMLAAAARELEIEQHGLNTLRGERRRGAWHIQNINAYHRRLKGGLARFRGVATSYLANYLGWHRALDRNRQIGANAKALLALAISA